MNTQKEYFQRIARHKRKLAEHFGEITNESGIYILTRADYGLKFAYVGQAKHILERLAGHLEGHKDHIDKSLKKHGLYDKESNPQGWRLSKTLRISLVKLNEVERNLINMYGNAGYQLLNKTSGGQDGEKQGIAPNKESKGYYDGLHQGYLNARRDVAKLFKANLIVQINGKEGVRKQKALEKFLDFINVGEENNETEETDNQQNG